MQFKEGRLDRKAKTLQSAGVKLFALPAVGPLPQFKKTRENSPSLRVFSFQTLKLVLLL